MDTDRKQMDKKAKKRKVGIPQFRKLADKSSILGMVKRSGVVILVYNGQQHSACMFVVLTLSPDLGCFGDMADIDSSTTNSRYWVEWERKATTFVHCDPFLLLFSPGYIEVREIEIGEIETGEIEETEEIEEIEGKSRKLIRKLKLVEMVGISGLRHLRSSGLTEELLGVMAGSFEDDGSRTEKLVKLIYRGVDT